MPNIRVFTFVGRQRCLTDVFDAVSNSKRNPAIAVLTGTGGQGKTQIALGFCQRSALEYRGIFWVDASSEASTTYDFERIADLLSGNGGCSTLSDSCAKITNVKDTLRTWTGRWLLVFDNYDTPCTFTNIAEYFPTAAGDPPNTILVTSRQLECGRLGAHIKVSGLTDAEGLELLVARSGATSSDLDRFARQSKWGEMIVNKLGYLPLGIDQAAAYITIRQLSLKALLQQLKSREKLILASAPTALWEYRKRSGDDDSLRGEHLSVLTTWELSFDQKSGPDPDATRAFLILSVFLNPTYISEILFRNFVERSIAGGDGIAWAEQFFLDRRWHSFQFQDTIAALANLSLMQGISFTGQEVGFSLHPLVKVAAVYALIYETLLTSRRSGFNYDVARGHKNG